MNMNILKVVFLLFLIWILWDLMCILHLEQVLV
jgi:hypothetical protein